MAPPGTDPSAETAATPRPRKLADVAIAAFLAFQVVVPLTYYFGDEVYDERFGWRMFSTLRLQECDLRVEEVPKDGGGPRVARLHESLHVAWINLMKRARPAVIEKALHARCAEPDVGEVRLQRACRDTDGTTLPRQHWVLDCATSVLRMEAPTPGEAP